MQRIIEKKSYPSAFNSDALGTNYDKDSFTAARHFGCNETSYAKPSTSNLASTGTFLLQQSRICCIKNIESNAMLLSLQILPCNQFMSFYSPDTVLIELKLLDSF